MISIFGHTGFIGTRYKELYGGYGIHRNIRSSQTKHVLYLISTVDNYNMFDHPFLDIDTNLTTLVETLEACRKQYGNEFVFNFTSSFFVYGNNQLPFKEDMLCNPMGFYSVTKFAAERLIETYCRYYNIPYRIMRLANVYGPGDKFSRKKNAFQYLLDKMQKDEEIPIYGDGTFVRDMIYLDDVCEGIKFCIYNCPRDNIYNIGSGIPRRWIDLMDGCKLLTNSQSQYKFVDPPEFHNIVGIKDAYLDVNKMKGYGWQAKTSMNDGVRKLLNHDHKNV